MANPEKIAAKRFELEHPGERVSFTRLAADEPSRWVAGVFHGDTRPPRHKFYAVDKATLAAAALDDDEPYRPKVWR